MTEFVVRSIDEQIRVWAHHAQSIYRVSLTKKEWRKMLMGGRAMLRDGEAARAMAFVYRRFSKRWQYLNDDRIAEFISENYGVDCTPIEDRKAA